MFTTDAAVEVLRDYPDPSTTLPQSFLWKTLDEAHDLTGLSIGQLSRLSGKSGPLISNGVKGRGKLVRIDSLMPLIVKRLPPPPAKKAKAPRGKRTPTAPWPLGDEVIRTFTI